MGNIDFNRHSDDSVKVRQPFLILGPPRSATTFLQQSLSMNGAGVYEPLAVNKYDAFSFCRLPDKECLEKENPYSGCFINNIEHANSHYLQNIGKPYCIKEVLSPSDIFILDHNMGDSNDLFDFFLGHENSQDVPVPKTIWMFRNPLNTFASIKYQDLFDFDGFVDCFKRNISFYETMNTLYLETTVMVTQDDLMGDVKEKTLRKLCQFLDIEFTDKMLHPENDTEETYRQRIFLSEGQKNARNKRDHHRTIRTGVVEDKRHLLSDEEKSTIEKELSPLYERIVAERRALPSLEKDMQLTPSL